MTQTGEEEAWDILSNFDSRKIPAELTCLGQTIAISITDRKIRGTSSAGNLLLERFGFYSRLSILRYLIRETDRALSGQLVRPSDLPGGGFFVKGSHVLPLDKLAKFFDGNLDGFLNTGKTLGGTTLDYGDTSLKLLPLPRVPIVLILWAGDEEFSPRASLLFDSSCVSHISIDILWSTAMLTIEMMLATP